MEVAGKRKESTLSEKWRQMKLKPRMQVTEQNNAFIVSSYIPGTLFFYFVLFLFVFEVKLVCDVVCLWVQRGNKNTQTWMRKTSV